jgi:hypothetical protein
VSDFHNNEQEDIIAQFLSSIIGIFKAVEKKERQGTGLNMNRLIKRFFH